MDIPPISLFCKVTAKKKMTAPEINVGIPKPILKISSTFKRTAERKNKRERITIVTKIPFRAKGESNKTIMRSINPKSEYSLKRFILPP
ncbi:MAG: hypothetical protein QW763_01195 [Archaeoglobaceae archaeon]